MLTKQIILEENDNKIYARNRLEIILEFKWLIYFFQNFEFSPNILFFNILTE